MSKTTRERSLNTGKADANPDDETRRQVLAQFNQIIDNALDNGRGAQIGRLMARAIGRERSEDVAARKQARLAAIQAGEDVGLYIYETGEQETVGFSSKTGEVTIPVEGLMIEDPDKLLTALRFLRAQDLQNDPKMEERVGEMTAAIHRQLIAEYEATRDGEGDPGRFLVLVGKMGAIVERVAELTDVISLDKLRNIVENSQTMTLGEYLQLDKAQCFDTPEMNTFGPSQWHMDSPEDYYQKSWNAVRKAVDAAQKNPNASTLVYEALANLSACATYAKKDIEKYLQDETRQEDDELYINMMTSHQKVVFAASEWIDRELEKISGGETSA